VDFIKDTTPYFHLHTNIGFKGVVMSKRESAEDSEVVACNEVLLVGRVSSAGLEKELPSGDKVVEFRIVVDRKAQRGKKREVDTLDIAAWTAGARRSALSIKVDQWVEVNGAVRRRFWQAPSGLASRWQVEAHQISRI
jgi:single-strand DNA-binding protein